MSDDTAASEVQYRLRKLQLEIQELSYRTSWQRRLGGWAQLGSTLLPYLALIFTVYQFSLQQELTRKSIENQTQSQVEASNRAFMGPVIAKQADFYFETATAAAQYVSSDDPIVQKQAVNRFFALYWEPLVMLESQEVVKGMRAMKFCMERPSRCSAPERQDLALYLASVLQQDYFRSWSLTPEQFAARTHNYQKSVAPTADLIVGRILNEGDGPTAAGKSDSVRSLRNQK